MALDPKNYRQLVDTTVEIANKFGAADIIGRLFEDLKYESEPYRQMVMETIGKVLTNLGVSDINDRLEEELMDGSLYALQEQTSDEDNVMLNGFEEPDIAMVPDIHAAPDEIPQIQGEAVVAPLRRSIRERKSAIPSIYEVYLGEHNSDIGCVVDAITYSGVVSSPQLDL
ncbi:splicing factor 3B subunit 1-like [Telopea speciosissima]|uniref:splicing factor 3B subunit 1-like n=1 Tax=Telopea speciosissima TaxID=54955 RepID=UPI001CC77F84|nr:splicing factor 3B subunit 1-like [Telopea speciosissima]